MWFALSIIALMMLSGRRAAEKKAAGGIDSMAMVWLQQAVAIPLILAFLFLAKFYFPDELPILFWQLLAAYIALQAIYLYCYYRAISIADISYVAPLMTLFIVGNMIGAYLILEQIPTLTGVIGSAFILAGAWITAKSKKHSNNASVKAHKKALILVLVAIILSSIFSNLEVLMLRMSNPTSYNFYTSVLTVPIVILLTTLLLKTQKKDLNKYWKNVNIGVKNNFWPLAIVGITYTINMLATYQAKLIAPNQAYVSSIKAASVIPVLLMGVFIFKEKVSYKQWIGVGCMIAGLVIIALNL
jgi:transporter family protein